VRQGSLAFLAGASPAHTKSNHQYATEGRMGDGNKIHEAARREVLERNGISRECKQPRKSYMERPTVLHGRKAARGTSVR
jgi:hypothetical protein